MTTFIRITKPFGVRAMVLGLAVLLSACQQAAPTPTLTPTAIPTPTTTPEPPPTPTPEENRPPVIVLGVQLPTGVVEAGQTVTLRVGSVNDPDNDAVVYIWKANVGTIEDPGPQGDPTVRYTAPSTPGEDTVTVIISDGKGGITSDSVRFNVVVAQPPPSPPPSTPIPTPEPTPTPTATPTQTPTLTPTPTLTATPIPAPTNTPTPEFCLVTITEPADKSGVLMEISVRGTATTVCREGDPLWVLVEIGGRQWPQLAPLTLFPRSGTDDLGWFVTALVGIEGDAGKTFGILVISTTQEIDQEFTNWFEEGDRTGQFPGFIPRDLVRKGAEVKTGISVTRR